MTRVSMVAAALFLPAAGSATAAATLSVEVELHVPMIQSLETTPGLLDIPSPTPFDIERGTLDVPQPVTLLVSSNVPWELFIRQANAATGDPTKPAVVAVHGSLDGAPFSTIGASWRSFAAGEAVDRETLSLSMRIALSWATSPGEHEPRLEYRLMPREH